uniref:Uncharacterized protein n=1 Tax=Lepeophtheirus salmonis TaxID=72036 RepID=A0A0K2U7Y7_LEPSM
MSDLDQIQTMRKKNNTFIRTRHLRFSNRNQHYPQCFVKFEGTQSKTSPV